MTTILLLLLAAAAGYGWRAWRAHRDATRSTQEADRTIAALRAELTSLRLTDRQRAEDVARRKRYFEENDVGDAANQFRFISQVDLKAVRPVNREAVSVLYALEEWVRAVNNDWRISFEVSLGAFIKTPFGLDEKAAQAAFRSFSGKRVDFLIVDRTGLPTLAVEYHGSGHDLSDDAGDRMAVKRLALRRADIPLVEIPAKTSRAEIIRMVEAGLADYVPPIPPRQ